MNLTERERAQEASQFKAPFLEFQGRQVQRAFQGSRLVFSDRSHYPESNFETLVNQTLASNRIALRYMTAIGYKPGTRPDIRAHNERSKIIPCDVEHVLAVGEVVEIGYDGEEQHVVVSDELSGDVLRVPQSCVGWVSGSEEDIDRELYRLANPNWYNEHV